MAGVRPEKAPIGLIKPTVELAIEPLLATFLKENPLPVFGEPGPGSNAQAYGRELKGFRLVYLVTGWDTAKHDMICHKLDAPTGQELEAYSTSSHATGTAQGLYNPNTPIPVAQSGGQYSLVNGIFSTYWSGGGQYTSGSPIFGDGQVYQGSPATLNGQTAAADAFYGANTAFTFYQNVFGRNGIDGYDVPVFVHDTSQPGNASASWTQDPFTLGGYSYWISFGDAGSGLGSMTDFDIVAHEYSHLVNYRTAQVGMGGGTIEQKAINEASSDILAAFAKIWKRNGMGTGVGPSLEANRLSDWVNGEQVVLPSKGGTGSYYCVRDLAWPSQGPNKTIYQHDPSRAWYTGSDNWTDGHYGTGPIARGMYILTQGLSPYVDLDPSTRTWTSPFLPFGMDPIGTDAAARIWYQALTHNFSSNMTYGFLWSGLESAAIDLYGRGSTQHQAVNNALTAVNLAAPWRKTDWVYDVEPNNTQAQATVLPMGHLHHINNGIIDPNGDVDWFKFTLPAGHTLSFWVSSQIPSSGDGSTLSSAPGFELRDASGTTLLASTSGTPFEYVNPTLITGPHTQYKTDIDQPPPPPPDYYQTQAQYNYKNIGTTDQTVYLKIRQGIADSLGNDYTLDVRDWIRDVTLLGGSPNYLEQSW